MRTHVWTDERIIQQTIILCTENPKHRKLFNLGYNHNQNRRNSHFVLLKLSVTQLLVTLCPSSTQT